jgi:hypothetical protein
VTVIVASVLLITVMLDPLHQYTPYVNRAVNGPSEEQALLMAESIDYTTIISLERFHGSSEVDAYIHHGTSLSYTWANFIDSEVIDYYQNRYNYQQKQIRPRSVSFTYNANVTYLEQLHIFNITQPVQYTDHGHPGDPDYPRKGVIAWYNITKTFYGSDKTTPLKTTDVWWNTFYKNQTTFYKMPPEFNLTFNNCYLVEMNFAYDETYSRLAAFSVNIHQIVILDQNFEPLWLSITPPLYAIS